jgi:hypothetical protein
MTVYKHERDLLEDTVRCRSTAIDCLCLCGPSSPTSPARSPVTLTMTMTLTMTLLPPMNRMIAPEYFFVFVGSAQGMFFFFSMFPQASYVKGT